MQRRILLLILLIAGLVNLVAAFGPELGFDALWYHLTIPKIYLMWGKIDFIPGGLLYYSAMPRLGEILYMGAMGVMGEMGDLGAHLINWGAGIGTGILTFKIARKYLSEKYSLLAAIIFYVTPLVGWQSGSAYVDLIRTFFEAGAFYFLFSNPILAGIFTGLAVGTKTLALGSLGILGVLGILGGNKIKKTFLFFAPAVLLSAPWFVWAYLKTGYPFYPIGAGILDASHELGGLGWLGGFGNIVNPIYLILLPFFFLIKKPKILTAYVILTFFVWLVTPHTGEGRFLLPYLPVWAVLGSWVIRGLGGFRGFRGLLIGTVLIIALANIGYRATANFKVVPYLLGKQTKTQYLCSHLDFSTRVFVDCDGWWGTHIKPTDLVLVKGYHNLYYINFPFIHETWYKGEKVDYVLDYQQP